MVAGGLAADSEHGALANSYPTPPTHENQQHTLSPGIELMDTTCSLTAFGDSTLNIQVSFLLTRFERCGFGFSSSKMSLFFAGLLVRTQTDAALESRRNH